MAESPQQAMNRAVGPLIDQIKGGDVHLRLGGNDLYLLHEALGEFVLTLHDTPRAEEVEDVLNLRDRIGWRIDDLIIAAGGDPT